jgi:hypothetical protein
MRYREDNLIENFINEGYRERRLEIADHHRGVEIAMAGFCIDPAEFKLNPVCLRIGCRALHREVGHGPMVG